MKIVSVMTTTSLGGAEFAAIEMLDALRGRGHDVVMLTNDERIARDTDVPVRAVALGPKLSTSSWPSLLLRWPPYVARLRRALTQERPFDVLLVHYKKEQLMSRLLPRSLRPTLVWAEWGPVPFPLRRGLPRLAYLDAARRAGLVMAISSGTRDSVLEVGVPPEKVQVVANVVRTEDVDFSPSGRAAVRERLGIPPDAFTVGCVSRFHPKKRNDVVVDAVARLGDEAHLVLAGSGETEADLRTRAAPLGDRVHFVPTPGDDIGDVLSAFDVSVFCPSPTEGAPRAVILAMLAQRPCVSTGAEGVHDIITRDFGAITTPENDPESLVAALRPYVGDPARVTREGAEARRRAEAVYAAPVVAERIEGLFLRAGPQGARAV